MVKKFNVEEFPADHEGISIGCDPNYQDPENPFKFEHGIYSPLRRCNYGRDTSSYVLEYGNEFWQVFSKYIKRIYLFI